MIHLLQWTYEVATVEEMPFQWPDTMGSHLKSLTKLSSHCHCLVPRLSAIAMISSQCGTNSWWDKQTILSGWQCCCGSILAGPVVHSGRSRDTCGVCLQDLNQHHCERTYRVFDTMTRDSTNITWQLHPCYKKTMHEWAMTVGSNGHITWPRHCWTDYFLLMAKLNWQLRCGTLWGSGISSRMQWTPWDKDAYMVLCP